MSMSDDRDYRRRPADFTNLAPGSALGQSTYFSSHEKEAFEAWCIEVVAGRKIFRRLYSSNRLPEELYMREVQREAMLGFFEENALKGVYAGLNMERDAQGFGLSSLEMRSDLPSGGISEIMIPFLALSMVESSHLLAPAQLDGWLHGASPTSTIQEDALAELERRLSSISPTSTHAARIHIDVLPAMTGVTLFQALRLQRHTTTAAGEKQRGGAFGTAWLPSAVPIVKNQQGSSQVVYDKTENIDRSPTNESAVALWSSYDFLLTDQASCHIFEEEQPSSESEEAESADLGLFEPYFEVQAYVGVQIKRPRTYLQELRYQMEKHGKPYLHPHT
ncbi:unnamed protein product [Tilletia controversa]|nr:unnamed protein product [Tilletia controversa]CAD7061737.1 unnamed protein product [Tilletia caries]